MGLPALFALFVACNVAIVVGFVNPDAVFTLLVALNELTVSKLLFTVPKLDCAWLALAFAELNDSDVDAIFFTCTLPSSTIVWLSCWIEAVAVELISLEVSPIFIPSDPEPISSTVPCDKATLISPVIFLTANNSSGLTAAAL